MKSDISTVKNIKARSPIMSEKEQSLILCKPQIWLQNDNII